MPDTSEGLSYPTRLSPIKGATIGQETDLETLAKQLNLLAPKPGFLQPSASATVPDGWLACDGAEVNRTTYARVFAEIGTTYGAGDGSTTFNVPDLRGRVVAGVDGAAGRMPDNDTLGATGGSSTVTLTTDEMPAHTHGTGLGTGAVGSFPAPDLAINPAATEYITGSAGGGDPHENRQPYLAAHWLIKT